MLSQIRVRSAATCFYLSTPFHKTFIERMKATIPAPDRVWHPNTKEWVFPYTQAQRVKELVKDTFLESVDITLPRSNPTEVMQLKVYYLSRSRERTDWGGFFALGYDGRRWIYRFPQQVLLRYFNVEDFKVTNPLPNTLYEVLGVSRLALATDIKSAYRRLAREWHPDVCKEPDAADRFRRVNDAYQTLSNSTKRSLYDVGLTVAKVKVERNMFRGDMYRAPFRSGLIEVEGTAIADYVNVVHIRSWVPLVENGRTLISSWTVGATEPTLMWV